jgi:hypothetical protein
MRRFLFCIVVAAVFGAARPALADTIVFSDNFNNENGGNWALNYTGFANWTVTNGSVDLIGVGSPYDFLPGNGLYLDMDGSTNDAGTIVSKSLSLAAGSYLFSFDLAGNQRGDPNVEPVTAEVQVGVVTNTYSLADTAPFKLFTLAFTLGAPKTVDLSFSEVGNSNIGMLLDNVTLTSVSSVPLPSAALGGLVLIGCMAAVRARKQLFA